MKRKNMRLALFIILGLIIAIAHSMTLIDQANAQDDVITTIANQMRQKKIPVKQIDIINRSPLQIEIFLQGASLDDTVAPQDPIYAMDTIREITENRRNGVQIDTIKVSILNAQAKVISWGIIPIDASVDRTPILASKINNNELDSRIRESVPLGKMALDKLDVSNLINGTQAVTMTISAPDLQAANEAIFNLMQTLPQTIEQLKVNRGAAVTTYMVDISDSKGQPLLKYVRYYLPTQELENWWQAPGITQDWFPHPSVSTGASNKP